MTNVRKINHKSDFDFILVVKDSQGNDVGFPDYDFSGSVSVGEPCKATSRKFPFSRKGDTFVNCFNDNGKIHIVCNDHHLSKGQLWVELKAEVPNGIYSDGSELIVIPQQIGIELVCEKGDIPTDVDSEFVVPFIYISAYEMAKRAGYNGTEEEYADFTNRLPSIVEEAENLNALMTDWAKGKQEIAKALTAWGVETSDTEPFGDLAKKIAALPVKGKNEDGVLSHTFRELQSWDLLQELNNHQRTDYPYCYGILLGYRSNAFELRGADAYYTSDGKFYEGDTDHVFELDNTKNTVYIIFYFKEPEYTVTQLFQNTLQVLCFSGRPRFNIATVALRLTLLECCTAEKYGLDAAGINISNISSLSALRIAGLTSSGGHTIANSCGGLTELTLPNLTEVSGGNVASSCSGLTELTLPALTEISGGNVASNCGGLTEVTLPALTEISDGTIAYNCNRLTELTLPNLTEVSGGNVASSCSGLTELTLPALTEISGGNVASSCGGLTELTLPKLRTFRNIAANVFLVTGTTKITRLDLPSLELGSVSSTQSCISTANLAVKTEEFVFDMPSLKSTYTAATNASTLYISNFTGNLPDRIRINIGCPQDGETIRLDSVNATNRDLVTILTVKSGFRGNLWVANYSKLTRDVMLAIFNNLADNNEYPTLTISLHADVKARLTEEDIKIATDKNFTIS